MPPGPVLALMPVLVLQQVLMALTPEDLSGHALGLHSSGMLAMQGVGAALAGAVAQVIPPPAAMAAMATVSVAVTRALAPGLRPERRQPRPPGGPGDLRATVLQDAPAGDAVP